MLRKAAIPAAPPWLRLLRPLHWTKNLLIFVPALTSSLILEPDVLAKAVLAFISFCSAASAGYVLNDLTDLNNDRDHPEKGSRPLGSGQLKISTAIGIGVANFACALATGFTLGVEFSGLVIIYLLLTAIYSLFIKRFVCADIITLVCLYLIRIAAGAAAISVSVSTWLLFYATTLFLSLACMKRHAELTALKKSNQRRAAGRAYTTLHLPTLLKIGIGAGIASITILGFYIADPATARVYSNPSVLWPVFMLFGIWIAGLWVSAYSGQMTNDPIVFVFSTLWSVLCMMGMLILTLVAQINVS